MRRHRAALLLLAVSTCASIVVAEGLVRWLRPGYIAGPTVVRNPFWRHDARLGWFHNPGQTGVFSRPEFEHHVSINSMGFRDRERGARRAAEAPSGRPFRVAVLGDSFAWGHGVEDDQVFTRLLERLLDGAEFWNLAVSAYSTDQELLLLRRVGSEVDPDLVIVMISRNDFPGNASMVYSAYPKPRFVERDGGLVLTNVPVPLPRNPSRVLTWLRSRSAFVNGLYAWLGIERARKGGPRVDRSRQIGLTLDLLNEIRKEASSLGAGTAVGLVPSVAHVYYDKVPETESRRFDAVRSWAAENGVPLLDLVPAFRSAFRRDGEPLHYRQDKHWNPAGHVVASEAMARLLGEYGLLDRS